MIDWSRCTTEPRAHQRVGVTWLTTDADPERGRVIPRVYLLGDEVGAGKSKQVVDAAQILSERLIPGTAQRTIDTVLVVGPAAARGVWADPRPALGEVAKHGWSSIHNNVVEYSVRRDRIRFPDKHDGLLWVVTNYEFIRRPNRLLPLLSALQSRRFMLVCDEAWALADNHNDQWKAVFKLRQMASRVVLLNGTPVVDTPLDVFGQMKMLDGRILNIPYYSHFRARYAMLKPNVSFPLITGYQNLEELRDKVAPYVLRRLTRDCFDLPEELEPILIEAKLNDEEWKLYRQMRDDMVAWLGANEGVIAQQSIVKGLRLAQITSGFLGGVQKLDDMGLLDFGMPAEGPGPHGANARAITDVREVGRSKLDAVIKFVQQLHPQPKRILVWGRFRPEIERTAQAFRDELGRRSHLLYGAQSAIDRQTAIDALNPDLDPGEPVAVVGSRGAGGAALNLSGASLEINLSYTFLLREYLQARGRTDRPGLRHRLQRVDVVATGPKGQRTIDHHVLAELREKRDIAAWTAATWRQKLLEE